jgi:hypothetical protein
VGLGAASDRSDYMTAFGTLHFAAGESSKTFAVYVTNDALVEGDEVFGVNLFFPTGGATLGVPSTSLVKFVDNDTAQPSANPADDTSFYVRQHYRDFLGRDPDTSGLQFWINEIESCGTDQRCRAVKRVNVSTAFFLSIEFKETGYFVIRAHKAGFGSAPSTPRYTVFLRDQREINEGLVVGQGNWQAQLEVNKQNYLTDFVSRAEFVAQFPQGQAAAAYVDKLFANAGATPSTSERNTAISDYGAGDTAGRAKALRSVIESGSVFNAEYNPAFVLMQYYGYLRRNPDDAPDNNFGGYNFWLNKLNSFSQPNEDMRDDSQAFTRVQKAEMVRAFIESAEYRQRFGGAASGNQSGAPVQGGALKGGGWREGLARAAPFIFGPTFTRLWLPG